MALAIGIFLAALVVIGFEWVDRTKIAALGATLVLLTQTIDQERAIESIDFNTIGLLAGMMLMVKLTEATGVYSWMAIRVGQFARGRPVVLVWSLAATTAVLSAFLDNLTTVLLVVPMTFLIADEFEIDAIPLVILEVIASNIGGTATLIGDPPNILIAGETGLSFGAFLTNLGPVVVVTFLVVTSGMYLVFRRRLQIDPEVADRVQHMDADAAITDPQELRRTLPVLIIAILVFFVHKQLHLEPATVALAGATVMLLVTSQKVDDALSSIEWSTLFFFISLFVMVGALEVTGAIDEVAEGVASLTGGNRTAELLGITWASALGSGIVDNIPFTAAMIPVVDQLGGATDDSYWWALSLGACFGGNATLIAAAANVAAAGIAERHGRHISFVMFLKVGIPATLTSVAIATAYILLRYA